MMSCPRCGKSFDPGFTACPDDGEVLLPAALAPADRDLARGERVGEYVVEDKVGAGTFGDVYRAVQPLIGKQVAIKVLSRRYSADPAVVSRFVAEARAVNQIRHKNIIDIFSFGQLPDGRHYHIMELLVGSTLEAYLNERGRLPLVEVILILRPLARALDAAHAAGIAHRDIKPANVFLSVDEDGHPFPKLLDFGIAKLMSRDVPRQHQTATGSAVGTPDYMSPEQCQGPNVDHRTDIYSFGVMAYQLVTGQVPFTGESVVDVLVKQMTEIPAPPSARCPDLPRVVDQPILAMMAKDKEARPPSLAQAVAALEVAANSSGLAVPRSSASADPLPESARARPSFLAEPELAATLPFTGSSAPLGARPRNGRTVVLGMLALMACVSGFIAWVLYDHGARLQAAVARAEEARAQVPARAPDPTPPAPAELPPPPTVRIQFSGSPEGAEVLVAGEVRCKLPCTSELAQGAAPVLVEVRAPGHQSEKRELAPLADGTLSVTLKKRLPKKKGLDDLESFD